MQSINLPASDSSFQRPANWKQAESLLYHLSSKKPLVERKTGYLRSLKDDKITAVLDQLEEENPLAIIPYTNSLIGFINQDFVLDEDILNRNSYVFEWGDEKLLFKLGKISYDEFVFSSTRIAQADVPTRIEESSRLAFVHGTVYQITGNEEILVAKEEMSIFCVYSQILYVNKLFM